MSSQTLCAVVVGINYRGTDNELNGCINDATNIVSKLLVPRLGAGGMDKIKILTDDTVEKPTLENIKKYLEIMVTQSSSSPDDKNKTLFFTSSSHGCNVPDLSGKERDGQSECIFTIDEQLLVDTDLRTIVDRVPRGTKMLILSDSCHSGTIANLKYTTQPIKKGIKVHHHHHHHSRFTELSDVKPSSTKDGYVIRTSSMIRKAKRPHAFASSHSPGVQPLASSSSFSQSLQLLASSSQLDSDLLKPAPPLPSKWQTIEQGYRVYEDKSYTETNGSIVAIAGCFDNQTSLDAFVERKSQGALTFAFLKTLESYRGKKLTYRRLLAEMSKLIVEETGSNQQPVLSFGKFVSLDDKFFIS